MRAILFDKPGEPEVLYLGDAPEPQLDAGSVLIEVAATAVNRADLMQRRGLYPPPPGASPILGLEVAGTIAALGPGPGGNGAFVVGQKVMALLSGGGYAERVAVPSSQVMRVPDGLTLTQAAAIPEVFLTAYLNLFQLGGLPFAPRDATGGAQKADAPRVLIQGGASGVGSAALQLCRVAGLTAYCTVGDDVRRADCLALGATAAWNYKSTDFCAAIAEETGGRGVDVVLDCVGGSYLERHLRSLALDGRIVCIGLQGGSRAEVDLGLLLRSRAQLIGSTLRPLPVLRKAALCHDFSSRVLPLFDGKQLRPSIDRVLPLAEAAAAHRLLDGPHVGKIVLTL
jgi:tumor protein p53-inducible protein 3